MSAFVGPSLAGVKSATLSKSFSLAPSPQHLAAKPLVCCLIDNDKRCGRPACSHVFSKRIEKAVQQRRLLVYPDPRTRHTNICVEHRRQLVPPSNKTTTMVQTRTPPPPGLAPHNQQVPWLPQATPTLDWRPNGACALPKIAQPPQRANSPPRHFRPIIPAASQSAGDLHGAAVPHSLNGSLCTASKGVSQAAVNNSSGAVDVVSNFGSVPTCEAMVSNSDVAVSSAASVQKMECEPSTSSAGQTGDSKNLQREKVVPDDAPTPNWSALSASTLRRCGRHLRVPTRAGSNRQELAAAVAQRAKLIQMDQKQICTYFVYFAKTRSKGVNKGVR